MIVKTKADQATKTYLVMAGANYYNSVPTDFCRYVATREEVEALCQRLNDGEEFREEIPLLELEYITVFELSPGEQSVVRYYMPTKNTPNVNSWQRVQP